MRIVERVVQTINAHPVFATLSCLLPCLYLYTEANKPNLRGIPTIGYSHQILSYIDAVKYLLDPRGYLQRGYEKYRNRAFKFPTVRNWVVVLNGAKYLEEVRKVPQDTLSLQAFINEATQAAALFGPKFANNHYHIPVIRHRITRKVPEFFDEMYDEAQTAFGKYLPMSEEWTSYNPTELTSHLACQIAIRICVGAPHCRDDALIASGIGFAPSLFIVAGVMHALPKFLHPYVVRLIPGALENKCNWIRLLAPIIEERRAIRRKGEEHSRDVLSYLMDEVDNNEASDEDLALRVLMILSGALSTALTSAHALFHLASEQQYLSPLRAEIETAVAGAGWTKQAMDRVRNLDSFIKETMRMHTTSIGLVGRIALKDYTFSDGTFIPKGTSMFAPVESIHYDENNYPDAHKFRGFRFVNEGDSDTLKEEGLRHSFVTLTPEFMPFGLGVQACPGRFLASSLLKLIMSYLLLYYDFELEGANVDEAKRPDDLLFGELRLPNQKARLLFRKRRT